MLTGSDSAPAKANEAKQKNDIGAARDQVYLFASNAQTEAYERIYVKGKQATSNADVTAGNASTEVSKFVKDKIDKEYGTAKTVGLATIVSTDGGATITISTTDWKQEGNVADTGGTLTWKDLTQNLPTPAATPLEIGASVNYSTTLNEQTLSNWKVFYNEKINGIDYTYLIYGDYLPNAAISSSIKTTHNLGTDETYGILANNGREDLIDAMTTTSNWSALIDNGSINGTALSEEVTKNANVWAMGSPTVDLWVNSWNAKYPSDTLYIRYVDTEDVDDSNFYATGYAIGDSANPTTCYYDDLSSKTGNSNTLYFPEVDDDSCLGYWLASPSAGGSYYIMYVWSGHILECDPYIYDANCFTFRPVIKLPTSVVNQ